MSIALTCVTFVLTHTVTATGSDPPQGRETDFTLTQLPLTILSRSLSAYATWNNIGHHKREGKFDLCSEMRCSLAVVYFTGFGIS